MTKEEIKEQLEGLGCKSVHIGDTSATFDAPDGKVCIALQIFEDNFDDFTFDMNGYSMEDRTIEMWIEWED